MKWLWSIVALVVSALLLFSVLAAAGVPFALEWAYWLAYHLGLDPP